MNASSVSWTSRMKTSLTVYDKFKTKGPLTVFDDHLPVVNGKWNKWWQMGQVVQLSQIDRTAGWISYGQKWKTATERQYLRTL